MMQFLYTAIAGAIVYTIGFLITDGSFMPIAGFFFSALVAGIFVLPLRLALKLMMPQASQQLRALISGVVLMAPATYAALNLPTVHMSSSRLGFFLFWLAYLTTLVVAQFWPLASVAADMPVPSRLESQAVLENTSGQGPTAAVPIEVDRWNWGAFLLNWIWGIGNSTYIALLMFVPLVNIAMVFLLGAKGSAWAWRNRRWDSIEEFQRTQRNWTRWSLAVYAVVLVLGIGAGTIALKTSVAYQLAVTRLQSSSEANAALGTPIDAGFPMGHIEVSGDTGSAQLSFGAEGPRAKGQVHLAASKQRGQWKLDQIELDVAGQAQSISLGANLEQSSSP